MGPRENPNNYILLFTNKNGPRDLFSFISKSRGNATNKVNKAYSGYSIRGFSAWLVVIVAFSLVGRGTLGQKYTVEEAIHVTRCIWEINKPKFRKPRRALQ